MPAKDWKRVNKQQVIQKNILGTEPVGRLLFKLAVPTIAAQLINMLYNMVDRIYIGHIPGTGTLALTGVGVCLPVIMIIMAFSAFVSAGAAPRASISLGREDKDGAEKIIGNAFTFQVILSLILTAVLLIWNRDFLLAFGASENTIGYATGYMNIYAVGTLFVQLTLGMNAFITAQGFAKTSMFTVLIGAVVNIILDPIFIFGFNMGVQGAALATVISQGISCVWVILFLVGKKTNLKLRSKNLKLKSKIILPFIALGAAPFIMIGSESIITVSFNSSLLKYGGDIAVGAMTILSSVMQFTMMPMQGLGQGAQPIIGFNYGAGSSERVRKAFRLLLTISLCYSTLLWALIQLFPQLPIGIFTSDEALTVFAERVIRIFFTVSLLFGIQMASQMTLIAIGSAKESVIIAIVRKFVLLLPLIYIMPNLFSSDKAVAVYAAEPVADFIAVTFTVILFSVQFRKTIRGMKENQSVAVH